MRYLFPVFWLLVSIPAFGSELCVKPVGDLPWFELVQPELGDQALILRLPEHIVTLKGMEDGDLVLAIASDRANGITFNLNPETSCIHQNVTWQPLQPGETQRCRIRVYLFRAGLEELLQRYQKEYNQTRIGV